jgi:hypothetical protein
MRGTPGECSSCGLNRIDRRNSQTLPECALVRAGGRERPPGSGKREPRLYAWRPNRARESVARIAEACTAMAVRLVWRPDSKQAAV